MKVTKCTPSIILLSFFSPDVPLDLTSQLSAVRSVKSQNTKQVHIPGSKPIWLLPYNWKYFCEFEWLCCLIFLSFRNFLGFHQPKHMYAPLLFDSMRMRCWTVARWPFNQIRAQHSRGRSLSPLFWMRKVLLWIYSPVLTAACRKGSSMSAVIMQLEEWKQDGTKYF